MVDSGLVASVKCHRRGALPRTSDPGSPIPDPKSQVFASIPCRRIEEALKLAILPEEEAGIMKAYAAKKA